MNVFNQYLYMNICIYAYTNIAGNLGKILIHMGNFWQIAATKNYGKKLQLVTTNRPGIKWELAITN